MNTAEVIGKFEQLACIDCSFDGKDLKQISEIVMETKKKFEKTTNILNDTYITIQSLENELSSCTDDEDKKSIASLIKKAKKKFEGQIINLHMYKIVHTYTLNHLVNNFKDFIDSKDKEFAKTFLIKSDLDITLELK